MSLSEDIGKLTNVWPILLDHFTLGRDIQKYAPTKNKEGGYVFIDGIKVYIKVSAHTISGYSAHADQQGLINFVKRMRHKPTHIKLVHGDEQAKSALAEKYQQLLPKATIEIASLPIVHHDDKTI